MTGDRLSPCPTVRQTRSLRLQAGIDHPAWAYAALLCLGLIWGSNFVFMKWATDLISPMQTVFLRVLFGFLALLPLALQQRALTRDQWVHLPHFALMSGLATTLYYHGFVAGTALLPSNVAGLLSGSIPLFTFLCAFLFLKQDRPTRRMAAGVALGFFGIVLSARPWDASSGIALEGVLWMLSGTASLGISFVYSQRYLSPLAIPPLALATWQTGIALLTLLLLIDFDGITRIGSDPKALLGTIVGLGILGTGVAFLCYYFIIGRLGSVKASGATYIAPVVAVAIGAWVGETITVTALLALLLILGGVILIQSGKR